MLCCYGNTGTSNDAMLTWICLHAEVPTLIVLSKIDTYDPDIIGNDLAKTFHSSRLLDLVEVSEPNLPKEITCLGLGIQICSIALPIAMSATHHHHQLNIKKQPCF